MATNIKSKKEKKGKINDVFYGQFCCFYRQWRIHMHLFARIVTLASVCMRKKKQNVIEKGERKENGTIHAIREISTSQ